MKAPYTVYKFNVVAFVLLSVFLTYTLVGYLGNHESNSKNTHKIRSSFDTKKSVFENPTHEMFPPPKNRYDYDSKLTTGEKNRLGFAIEPEFQILPPNLQSVVTKKNGKIPRKQLVENLTNFNSNFKSMLKKKILIHSKPIWLKSSSCLKIKSETRGFQCEFTAWENSTIQMGNIAGHYDAIFVHSISQYINSNWDSIYSDGGGGNNTWERGLNLNSNKTAKTFYFTLESPFPPNNLQMKLKFATTGFINSGNNDYSENNERLGHLATYWRGSDIYSPYSKWTSFSASITTKLQETNYATGRTKMAAIVVSNCNPNNNRLGFVEELQKYISVDVYGKCGTMECDELNCFTQIKKHYKFYLAFENSNCRDYITEKLFRNAFSNDLLPIVLGAHPVDYKAIAPQNSYIHIEDFETTEKLGQYLQILDQNDTLYNNYFTWKGTGHFETENENGVMGQLCAYLHAQDILELQPREQNGAKEPLPYFNSKDSYNFDTFDWTSDDPRLCLGKDEWYWNKELPHLFY